jgi:outer membrane immunogenic protein
MYRKIGSALTLASLAALPAAAADLPPVQPAPVYRPAPVVTVYNWSGFYVGLNGGYGLGDLSATASDGIISLTVSETLRGPLAGGQAGVNWQGGNWVFGIEVDAQWSDINKTGTFFGVTVKDSVSWFGTARLRLGYAADNVLIYATGGGAYGEFKSEATAGGLSLSASESRAGWTGGGGVEVGGGPWSFKAEYLFVQSVPKDYTLGGITVDSKVSINVVRAGLNYRFGGGAVRAAY